MKVMAAASIGLSSELRWEAAESALGCDRDSRLDCCAAGRQVSDSLLPHLPIAPEFGCREKILHFGSLASDVECLTVGETVC